MLRMLATLPALAAALFAQGPTGNETGTWILQVEGDASGLRVTAATHKSHTHRPATGVSSDYVAQLIDRRGNVLDTVPIDLRHFCMDRTHAGDEPHVIGDQVVSHDIVQRVKIPARTDLASVRLEAVAEGVRRHLATVPSDALPGLAPAVATGPVVKTVMDNGPPSNRYDIVILAEGYQAHEEATFDQDVSAVVQNLFARPAYATYRSFFNVHTVFRASAESGADEPAKNPPIYRDTAYDCTYNFGGTRRCLYVGDAILASADAMLAPDVEQSIMVLVNSKRYGGCGGSFSVSYTGRQGPDVQAHEFGHSFGRLADEYSTGRQGTYPGGEPWQANISADPTGAAKWPLWLGTQGVGAFQGAGYYRRGLYRPKRNCLMRNVSAQLCPVCNEQLVKQVHAQVSPLEPGQPAERMVALQKPGTHTFAPAVLPGVTGSVSWTIDGQPAGTGPTFTWDPHIFPSGRYTIAASIVDQSPFVRSDPNSELVGNTSWSVDLLSYQPGSYSTLGKGCAGSRIDPCMAANEYGAYAGGRGLTDATYAIEVVAQHATRITGFELHTSSRQTFPVSVPVALYTSDDRGFPADSVRSGTMLVGGSQGWYAVELDQPYDARAGERVFLTFDNPSSSIDMPWAMGSQSNGFLAWNGTWNGPFNYFWSYRITCPRAQGAVPQLSGSGFPEIGSSYVVSLRGAAAHAPAALTIGRSHSRWGAFDLPFELGPLGAPGCVAWVSGEATLPVQADASGAASLAITVPYLPSLVGHRLYSQFWVEDPAANDLGVVLSNAVAARVGR